jgi:hypothetical protein
MRTRQRLSFRHHARFLRRQFLQDGDLPFQGVLTDDVVSHALTAIPFIWLDRIFSPLVTLWVFLGQILSADHSCRAAVARLIAHRLARGQRPCSSDTGAYCQARKRLPERFFADVARHTGRALDDGVEDRWLWKRRRVYVYDGSSVSMPDTPANQAAYPQPVVQQPGLGFPLARIGAVFSLACGAILDVGLCRYAGKGQSELGILRSLWDLFRPGDVLLADRLMCAWTEIVVLKQRGVDCVCRFTSHRSMDFRRGKRLGPGDHLVQWVKPPKPRSVERSVYETLPAVLTIRECRVTVAQTGFRIRTLLLATTLLDPELYSTDELADLYRARWNGELDLRSLKQTLQMDVRRCKTPELVRKELWTHVLAYNLIRTVIAQAAVRYHVAPRSISFKAAVQTLEAFQPVITWLGDHDAAFRSTVYLALLDAIIVHRVADRPDRVEPRKKKRRPKCYDRLMVPRSVAKRALLKGVPEK